MSMTNRENLLSLLKRKSCGWIPPEFVLCPALIEQFKAKHGDKTTYDAFYNFPWETIPDALINRPAEDFYQFFPPFQNTTHIDVWGVGHQQGSESCMHMTKMLYPMQNFDSIEQFETYSYPTLSPEVLARQKEVTQAIHSRGNAAVAQMPTTVWETAWYTRSMEELMADMMTESPLAEYHFDRITDIAIQRAEAYAKSGADILFVGDDIGMQHTIMMSIELYCQWIKPRITKVIKAAKAVNPEIVVFYHSCGYVTPFIPHLIEAGVDVLNPVQPECMSFAEIFSEYKGALSFHGTIGTQSTMPFGTPEDVRREVFKNLEIAGKNGGLFVAPTHILEPEVPYENIEAYVSACKEYSGLLYS